MECLFKRILTLILVSCFCSSCSSTANKKYPDGVYDDNPKYLGLIYPCVKTIKYTVPSLYKMQFKGIDTFVYQYSPDTIELNKDCPGLDYPLFQKPITYIDRFVGCESNNYIVASVEENDGTSICVSEEEVINLNNLKLYFLLDDSCYVENGILKRLFIDVSKLTDFLKQYDYFYVYVNSLYSFYDSRDTHNRNLLYKNQIANLQEGALIYTKNYGIFPVKDSQIMLDDLQLFYDDACLVSYKYASIEQFSTFFWDAMDENAFIDSFIQLFENPPVVPPDYYIE